MAIEFSVKCKREVYKLFTKSSENNFGIFGSFQFYLSIEVKLT